MYGMAPEPGAVHAGPMRGGLREFDMPLDAVSLEPFGAPDLCLAYLARRSVATIRT
jgi:hypothetical protein